MPTQAKPTPEQRQAQVQAEARRRYPDSPDSVARFISLYEKAQEQGKGGYRHKPECVCGQCHRTRLCVAVSKMKPKHKRTRSAKTQRTDKLIHAYTDPSNPTTFGNGEEAAKAAGFAPHLARSQADAILSDSQVSGRVFAALEKLGVHDDFIAARLEEGMLAKSQKFFQHQGDIVKSPKFVDWGARHKHLETAMRARGDFPNEERQLQAIVLKIGDGIPTAQGWEDALDVEAERVSKSASASD